MSVNSKMTAIADELRALMGATGALTLDGMAQQAGAANDAADAQAGLIDQITEALQGKAGGGALKTGTFTAATSGIQTITHGLGKVPDYFVMCMKANSTGKTNSVINVFAAPMRQFFCYSNSNTTGFTVYQQDSETNDFTTEIWDFSKYDCVGSANEQTIQVGYPYNDCYLHVGTEYQWIAF